MLSGRRLLLAAVFRIDANREVNGNDAIRDQTSGMSLALLSQTSSANPKGVIVLNRTRDAGSAARGRRPKPGSEMRRFRPESIPGLRGATDHPPAGIAFGGRLPA